MKLLLYIPGEYRAGLFGIITNGDNIIEWLIDKLVNQFRFTAGYIDSIFLHNFNCERVDFRGWCGSGRVNLKIGTKMFNVPLSHLGPAGIAGTEYKDSFHTSIPLLSDRFDTIFEIYKNIYNILAVFQKITIILIPKVSSPMSLSRERLKAYAKLKQKKYRFLHKQFLVEGLHGIRDIVRADEDGKLIDAVIHTADFAKEEMNEKLIITLRHRGVKVYEVPKTDIERLSETVTNQEIVAVVHQWGFKLDTALHQMTPQLIVALDTVREPGNLGAIIRTCDWFGVNTLLLGKGTVEIWNPKVIRSAVGSIVHIPFVEDVDLPSTLPLLRSKGYFIGGTSVHGGVSIHDAVPELPAVIVFGNESDGISHEVLNTIDELLTIPKFGRAESLNVGVSAGVILSAIRLYASNDTEGK